MATTTVERMFINMKLMKTRLRSRMGEDTLDYIQCASALKALSPDHLSDDTLEALVDHYKGAKKRKLAL